MGVVKSKGTRLNWPLLDSQKKIRVSTKELLIEGRFITESELNSSYLSKNRASLLVP